MRILRSVIFGLDFITTTHIFQSTLAFPQNWGVLKLFVINGWINKFDYIVQLWGIAWYPAETDTCVFIAYYPEEVHNVTKKGSQYLRPKLLKADIDSE